MAVNTDPFLDLLNATWSGLRDAARECGWIADGGDPTASPSDLDLASAKEDEYKQAASDVADRHIAYMAKGQTITPPSTGDVATAQQAAANLAAMTSINVKVAAVINTATTLLSLYKKTI